MNISNLNFFQWWQNNSGKFRAILFDIDGTLIFGSKALPGAGKMLTWLREHHFPFYLLTNDGNNSTRQKSGYLNRAGFEISPEEIVSCGMAISIQVKEKQLKGQTFFVMGDLGTPCYAELAGLKVTRDPEEINDASGIIVGEGTYNWQDNINAAINAFRKYPEKLLIVPNPDSYWPSSKSGEFGIGAGGKARFICTILGEMGIQVEPIYLGKPHKAIFQYTMDKLKQRFNLKKEIPHQEIIMLGDSLKSDIQGAINMDFTSALLLTGITTEEQVRNTPAESQPELVFKSF